MVQICVLAITMASDCEELEEPSPKYATFDNVDALMSYGIDFEDIDKTNYFASGDHFATQLDAAESAAIDDGWTLDTTSPVSGNTPNSLPPWHLRSAADNGWPANDLLDLCLADLKNVTPPDSDAPESFGAQRQRARHALYKNKKCIDNNIKEIVHFWAIGFPNSKVRHFARCSLPLQAKQSTVQIKRSPRKRSNKPRSDSAMLRLDA